MDVFEPILSLSLPLPVHWEEKKLLVNGLWQGKPVCCFHAHAAKNYASLAVRRCVSYVV